MRPVGRLQWPFLLWMILFILAPWLYLAAMSFASRGIYGGLDWTFTTAGYWRSLDPIYLKILFRSLWLAFLTTVLCLFLGTLLAWYLATAPAKRRQALLALLCVPFFLNLVTRVYALRSIFGHDGILAGMFATFGIEIDLFALSQNQPLVLYGMVATYLPYLMFPVFVTLEKFDYAQVEAVYDLGGGSWRALRSVILPQITPALVTGALMVFVPAVGEYVIPDLLGGAKVMLVGNLITDQFLKARDWAFGAVLAVELMLLLGMIFWLLRRQTAEASRG